jgi:hypothetical protein
MPTVGFEPTISAGERPRGHWDRLLPLYLRGNNPLLSEGGLGIKKKKIYIYVDAAGFITQDVQPLAYSLYRLRCSSTCLCMVQL